MLSILQLVAIVFIALVVSLHGRSPKVQLRGTTIIGKRLRSSNLDFFGGHSRISILPLDTHLTAHIQVSLFPSLQFPAFVSPLLGQSSLLRPCNHSRPAITASNVCSLQVPLVSPHLSRRIIFYSIRMLTCQKTVLLSTCSDLLVLTSTPVCPSWFGFTGVVSIVSGGCPIAESCSSHMTNQAVVLRCMMELLSSNNQLSVYALHLSRNDPSH
jgi:hypothetical protein